MATQTELDNCYMAVAEAHASLSKSKRDKVGCCLVTTNGVILAGCNGMAPGGSNSLEFTDVDGRLVTKPHAIHAELSCILKAAKEGVSVVGATLYVTLSCCMACSEMVRAVGVKRVVYKDTYRITDGLTNLIDGGIVVEQFGKGD